MKQIATFCLIALLGVTQGCNTNTETAHPDVQSVTPTSYHLRGRKVISNPVTPPVVVPAEVRRSLKMKCYVCHGGQDTKGGFDFKKMTYQPVKGAAWKPIDLAGATRIKFAIMPLDGKAPKMPKRAGSALNSLTPEELNTVAAWTDNPY